MSATALLEPPGVTPAPHGLSVCPCHALWVNQRQFGAVFVVDVATLPQWLRHQSSTAARWCSS